MHHVVRMVEEATGIPLDTRRTSCHHRALSLFVKFGGLELLMAQFDHTVQCLWECQALEEDDSGSNKAAVESSDKSSESASRSPPKQVADSALQAFRTLLETASPTPRCS